MNFFKYVQQPCLKISGRKLTVSWIIYRDVCHFWNPCIPFNSLYTTSPFRLLSNCNIGSKMHSIQISSYLRHFLEDSFHLTSQMNQVGPVDVLGHKMLRSSTLHCHPESMQTEREQNHELCLKIKWKLSFEIIQFDQEVLLQLEVV
jgi:hypothetical protein